MLVGAGDELCALADQLNRQSRRGTFRCLDSIYGAREFLLNNDTPPPPLA